MDTRGSRTDVAVVGGGISGLWAGIQLARRGQSVVVLEAGDQPGGRVRNLDIAGTIAEAGGEWVAPYQTRILELIKSLGLETFPTFTEGATILNFGGEQTRFDGLIPPLSDADVADITQAITTLDAMARQVPLDAPQDAPQAAEWDAQTVQNWLDANVHAAGARTLLEIGLGGPLGGNPRSVSLLNLLFLIHSHESIVTLLSIEGGAQDSRVVGGTQRITDALAAELGDRVLVDAPVRLIEQSEKGVQLTTERGRFHAGRAIVAVPPTVTNQIRFDPPLPATRAQFAQRAPMGWEIKCFAAYPTPFWRDAGLSGIVNSDTGPFHACFDNSPPGGTPGVLYALVEADDAREWGPKPLAERRAAVLQHFAAFFGEQALDPIDYVEADWAAEPWIRGCASMFLGPGVMTEYPDAVRAPIGRVHWAGTETATVTYGSMNGGLLAAERAVAEVV